MEWNQLIKYVSDFANQFSNIGLNSIQRSNWNGKLPLLSYNVIPNDDGTGFYEDGIYYHKAKIEFLLIEDVKTIDGEMPIDRLMNKIGIIKSKLVADEKITLMKINEVSAFDYKQGKMLDKSILMLECTANYTV